MVMSIRGKCLCYKVISLSFESDWMSACFQYQLRCVCWGWRYVQYIHLNNLRGCFFASGIKRVEWQLVDAFKNLLYMLSPLSTHPVLP